MYGAGRHGVLPDVPVPGCRLLISGAARESAAVAAGWRGLRSAGAAPGCGGLLSAVDEGGFQVVHFQRQGFLYQCPPDGRSDFK